MVDRDDLAAEIRIGLLAHRDGLVLADELVEAIRSWARGSRRPFGDVLIEAGLIDEGQRQLLEALHLEGEAPTPPPTPEPPLGPTLRDGLARVGLADTVVAPDEGRWDGRGDASGPRAADRYRLVRPHARGGLGVVYLATDGELHREVAVKRIDDVRADDPESRARFVREAEITGGLEHPGIVPVYGLGTLADGRLYYAMRFIRGETLKDAIHRSRDEPRGRVGSDLARRRLLRRFLEVCNAIDYAHSRGVLHRDLKPGNIMLGEHGETLVVDWGLAKPIGAPEGGSSETILVPRTSSDSARTIPGSAMGTPEYMSPEQAAGDWERLGPRADVYSLGATLFCLLAGRSPFVGLALDAMLRAVREGAVPSPRTIDRTIPRALEAVCLKAMALRPDDRYPTARALAEDVERWMDDAPVIAHRDPIPARIFRWARRNLPAVAAGVALLVTGLVTLAIDDVRVGRQKRLADDAGKLASESFVVAREAINHVLTEVATGALATMPGAEALRLKIADDARDLNERTLRLFPDKPEVRRDTFKTNLEVANIFRQLGRTESATTAYTRAIELIRGLVTEFPDHADYRLLLAEAINDDGERSRLAGRLKAAEAAYREALAALDPILSRSPRDAKALNVRGKCLLNLAEALIDSGQPSGAAVAYDDAVAIFRPLVDAPNSKRIDAIVLAMMLYARGRAYREEGRSDQSLASIRESIRRSGAIAPRDNNVRYVAGMAEVERGRTLATDPTRRPETRDAFDRAVSAFEALVSEFSRTATYRRALASALDARAEALATSPVAADRAAAEADWGRAQTLLDGLVAESSANQGYRGLLGRVVGRSGLAALDRGDRAAAIPLLERAVAVQTDVLKALPESEADRIALDRHQAALARARSATTDKPVK